MDLPSELPIVFSEKILIPGFTLKMKLSIKDNINLLDYLRNYLNLKNQIGVIPKIDFEKTDDVIGTVGQVCSLIQVSPEEEFCLIVKGICRFKLDATVSEEPLKINKILPITNFKKLVGDEKEQIELTAEFQKALNDFFNYSKPYILGYSTINKNILKKLPIDRCIDHCLKKIVILTPTDAYEILRAANLNHVLKFIIKWLKRETMISTEDSPFGKIDSLSIPPSFIFEDDFLRIPNLSKKKLPSELQDLLTKIENSKMPTPINDSVMRDFKRLEKMSIIDTSYSASLHYLSYVADLPWNKSAEETLDLEKAKSVLKLNHYGMDKVKNRILQFIAVRILNPKRQGPILCFLGPPGVGKTTIAKSIADSLNRKFNRVSLGGINQVSDIKGHRKTYIGSMPGNIIQAVNQTQTNNPVILLDEIDKMFKGATGSPAAALLEVLDPEQNASFVDSYVNFPFDLSQVMFVTTANNAAFIPPTLCDRMEMIYLDGYTYDEKIQIAENYLIPKILKEHKMNEVQITFCKNTIDDIIQKYTNEAGVRNLQRKLEAICQYIAVEMVENTEKKIKHYNITPKYLLDIFKHESYNEKSTLIDQCHDRLGVAIGLYWTPVGGKVQVIETSRINSRTNNNGLVLTGLAGKTLKESVEIALNWIQSFVKKNKMNINNFGAHVHLPEGGLKKDGPSAGVTIVCALVSLFWKIPLRPMTAMTGEISLKGYVLPVGGIKQKILAAYNSGITTIIIPNRNLKDVESLPQNILEDLNIVAVNHVEEVLDFVIPGGLTTIKCLMLKSKF